MTTPAKKYQNIGFPELMSYAKNNPNRSRTLAPIEVSVCVDEMEKEQATLEHWGRPDLHVTLMDPVGILSVFACMADLETYRMQLPNERLQKVSEKSIQFQGDLDRFKNTSLARKKKKINEAISASFNGTLRDEEECLTLYQGLSYLTSSHWILVHEAVQQEIYEGLKEDANADEEEKGKETDKKGTIFFSSDPALWEHRDAIYLADVKGGWMATSSEKEMVEGLGEWLCAMEEKGWSVKWPEVDLKKDELVKELSTYPSWKETDAKQVKAVLGPRLGKERALKQLHHLNVMKA